jgi:hypothetical protein
VEAAAVLLGAKVRSVTRQANRMRAAGVRLKPLTDPRFNRHDKAPANPLLTAAQREFMSENYRFALAVAFRACRSIDLPPHKVDDLVEDAAVTALVQVTRRTVFPDFVAATAKALLATAVRRQLWVVLREHFGPAGRKKLPNYATHGPVDYSPDRRFPNPAQEAIRREEEDRAAHQRTRALTILGALPDMSRRRVPAEAREYLSLRGKAKQLGISTVGTVADLRERIAAYIREALTKPLNPRQAAAEWFVRPIRSLAPSAN